MTGSAETYEEFYGLRARPFSLTPDLRFTYGSRSHTHALEHISQALKRREGLVVVTGEVGTGKTMLCRALLETFEARTFLSVILDPLLSVEDLLSQVLADFGLLNSAPQSEAGGSTAEVGRHDLVTTLHKFLSSLIPLNAHAVIMIDEAQHLAGPVLEQVRLLSNFETDEAKLLQIVLVGQPSLDALLQRPDMQQLNQRIARRVELEPLTPVEVRDYVERRLRVAATPLPNAPGEKTAAVDMPVDGGASPQFSDAALSLVAAISGGIPRVVNTLCDRALEAGFEKREHAIEPDAVRWAAEQLRLTVPSALTLSRKLSVAAALAVAVLMGAWWWSQRGPAAASAEAAPIASPTSVVPPTPTPSAADAPLALTPPPIAPAMTPPDPSATTPPGARYEVTAASFKTEGRAVSAAASLAGTGLPVASRIDSTGEWYRVVVGPFATQDQARGAQETLEQQGFPGSRISLR